MCRLPRKISPCSAPAALAETRPSALNRVHCPWKLAFPPGVVPRLDEQAASPVVGVKDSESKKRFERILSREIVPALNRASGFFNLPMQELRQTRSQEDEEELRHRAEDVKARLYTKTLEERLLIRKTCKGPMLEDLKWDISIKKHDLSGGTVPNIPYGTIELVMASEADGSNPLALLFGGSQRHTLAFDCHLHDLDAILRDLQELRNNLDRLTAERGE